LKEAEKAKAEALKETQDRVAALEKELQEAKNAQIVAVDRANALMKSMVQWSFSTGISIGQTQFST